MARGVNKVFLIGNMVADPESKSTQGGNAIANFNIATSEKWKDKQGQPQEHTEYHKCAAFGRVAEIINQYGRKGAPVHVYGKNKTRKYTAKDGSDRYVTEVIVYEFQLLDKKPSNGNQSRDDNFGNTGAAPGNDFNDSIPF